VHVKKRLFISLLGLAVAFILLLVLLIAYLAFNWNLAWHRLALMLLVSLVVALLGIVSFGVMGIVLTIWSTGTISILSRKRLIGVTLHLLFPVVMLLGRILRLSQERIRSSFIEVNNQLVQARQELVPYDQILVLAPHCLQNSDCPHKITQNPDNCRGCGRCPVNDLISLRDRYGIKLAFATGGTLARRFVQEFRPRAIIAIACDRDLASGIQDASPLPVLGILNERPCGPCFNTRVNLRDVDAAIHFFAQEPGAKETVTS
jgi:hypothetical protein